MKQLAISLFGCCLYQDVIEKIFEEWKQLSLLQKIGYAFGALSLIFGMDLNGVLYISVKSKAVTINRSLSISVSLVLTNQRQLIKNTSNLHMRHKSRGR